MKLPRNTALEDVVELIEAELVTHDLFFGHSTSNAFEEAAWMGLYVTEQDMALEVFDWETTPSEEQIIQLESLVKKRIETQLPFAYLIQEAWFCGLRFYVDERAIVPRSYFGEWIPDQFAPWIDASKVKRALDLCTGSGCIAIALADAFPEAQIDATELSENALAVAAINVERHNLQDRVKLYQGDLFADVQGTYDLICSNPPYISNPRMDHLPAEYLHEPDMAFRGGDEGLDLVDVILRRASSYLNDGGSLVVEVGTSALALEAKYPELDFMWLSTEDEATALFLLEKGQLQMAFPASLV
ncbi:MAG: 50S ribosomal protein L3 N(5)-glutamine methyltransferase [Arenicellales bacterium]